LLQIENDRFKQEADMYLQQINQRIDDHDISRAVDPSSFYKGPEEDSNAIEELPGRRRPQSVVTQIRAYTSTDPRNN